MASPALSPSSEAVLKAYDSKHFQYDRLAKLVAQFLGWRVQEEFQALNLPVLHLYQHRAKARESLERNLRVGRYGDNPTLEQVRDLAGVRLIFYFKDDLARFVRPNDLEGWFGAESRRVEYIHGSRLADGTRSVGPGYESFHVPVRVTRGTLFFRALQEADQEHLYRLYCEVQLRTILKHAWAEAEHDLRYKVEIVAGIQVPKKEAEQFVNAAKQIDIAEDRLSSAKEHLKATLAKIARPTISSAAFWQYAPHAEGCAFTYNGVTYGYELLDDGNHGTPVIQENADIFDIDAVMKRLVGVSQYKQTVWTALRQEQAEFISTIDHDTLVARVCNWKDTTRGIILQPAYYSDQVVTNHKQVLRTGIPGVTPKRTIGSLAYDEHGNLLPFDSSPMSNTLGVACVIRVEENHWIIAHRSRSVAFDPGLLGCPASGALEWNELGHWTGRGFSAWCVGGMARELEEELGFKADASDFHYLGFAREMRRAGKPQLFFFLGTTNTKKSFC